MRHVVADYDNDDYDEYDNYNNGINNSNRGVNPGGCGVATLLHFGQGVVGSQEGRKILLSLYLIMHRRYVRKW